MHAYSSWIFSLPTAYFFTEIRNHNSSLTFIQGLKKKWENRNLNYSILKTKERNWKFYYSYFIPKYTFTYLIWKSFLTVFNFGLTHNWTTYKSGLWFGLSFLWIFTFLKTCHHIDPYNDFYCKIGQIGKISLLFLKLLRDFKNKWVISQHSYDLLKKTQL